MTRFLFGASNSYSQLPQVAYRQLVDVGITSGTLYCCTGAQFIYALGNTYTPVGPLGGIEPIQEESDPFPRTVRAWLAAVDSSSMFEPLREDMFGRPLTVRHVYLDPQTFTPVSTPEPLWDGFINRVELRFTDMDRGPHFEVEAINALAKRAPVSNFNLETHWTAMPYSGDTFFAYVDQIPLYRAKWGQQPTSFASLAPGRGAAPVAPPEYELPVYFPM